MNADLIIFDCESTGLDVMTARIIQIAVKRTGNREDVFSSLVNPGFPIPPEIAELTGITDEMVSTAPKFAEIAPRLNDIFRLKHDPPPFLVAYNGVKFDIPLLWEEFNRVGLVWEPDLDRVIDPGELFKIRETRTLEAAVKFYCGKTMEGAHDAMNDVNATLEVLYGQVDRYDDLKGQSLETIAKASRRHTTLDVHAKIAVDADGDAIFNFGQTQRGKKIKDDMGFARWILGKDFSEDTKRVVSEAMEKAYREQKADTKQGGLF